jgi:hypothetical protein
MKPHEADWLALADAGMLQRVYFLHLDWPGGAVRVHSYIGDIDVGGHTWRGVGLLGTIESNGAAQVGQKPVITFKLSRVPGDAAGFMTPAGAQGRAASLYVGAKDPHRDDLTLIGGIHPEFTGRIAGVQMAFADVDATGVRRFDYSIDVDVGRSPRLPHTFYHSDADQRRRTATDARGADTAFRHLASAASEPLVWTPT